MKKNIFILLGAILLLLMLVMPVMTAMMPDSADTASAATFAAPVLAGDMAIINLSPKEMVIATIMIPIFSIIITFGFLYLRKTISYKLLEARMAGDFGRVSKFPSIQSL